MGVSQGHILPAGDPMAGWPAIEDRVRRHGAGPVLEALLARLRRHPDDIGMRDAFNRILTSVFTDSRRAFADKRWQDATYLFAVLADFGQPAAPLRADADTARIYLIEHAVNALESGEVAIARRECRQALAIAPACNDSLSALAYVERRHADAETGLCWTLRTLRANPSTPHGDAQLNVMVDRAGNALVQALRAADPVAARRLVVALQRGDADFERRVEKLIPAGGGPRDLERETLLWLGAREYASRRFEEALVCFTQASKLRVGATSLRWEGMTRQQLMLDHLRLALCAHCSSYINDIEGNTQSRDVFRALDALMVQGLTVENIDAWTRTQYWGSLLGWRAMVDYAQTLDRNPYNPPLNLPYAPPAAAQSGERRLFDCCTFFNEVEVLEIRLHELYDVVDGFVVAEATHTHAGQPKPLAFEQHRDRFRPWLDKITYVVDDKPINGFAWQREAQQRDALLGGLSGCRDDDIIIVSDVDEIVRRDAAAALRRTAPDCEAVFTLEMDLFFYRLDYRFSRDWRSAGAAPYRIVKKTGTNAVRYLALQQIGPTVPAAGWHFSWMGDIDRFIAKMTAYAHQEHTAEYAADSRHHTEEMRRFLTQGGPLPTCGPGNGMGEYTVAAVDDSFPFLVREAHQRYADMGWLSRDAANATVAKVQDGENSR